MYLQVVSARFMSHVLHVLTLGLCFWSWERSVNACNDPTSNTSYRNQLFVSYSLAIAFSVFELVPVVIGITSISIFRSAFAILLHFSATIGLIYFLLQHQCALRIWPIFTLCSCVPLFLEYAATIYNVVRQRL